MQVIYNTKQRPFREEPIGLKEPTGVGLGNFDGLHIGHMTLINTLIDQCKFDGLKSVVYTFMKHPENILRKKLFTPLLTTVGKKEDLLKQTSLDYLYFDEFDEHYSRMKPESFVKDILVGTLGIKLAVAGYNYRFGYKGQGDVALLEKMGHELGFKVIVISPVQIENEAVSSTRIRSCIAKGEMEKVLTLLGRYYSITGEVSKGRQIGSTLGFPTANIHPEDYLILPQEGVYLTKTLLSADGELRPSVTNIGKNPTIAESQPVSVETHILDFNDNIYSRDIEVFFISRLRGEKKFKDKEDLMKQMQKDVKRAREYFGSAAVTR